MERLWNVNLHNAIRPTLIRENARGLVCKPEVQNYLYTSPANMYFVPGRTSFFFTRVVGEGEQES